MGAAGVLAGVVPQFEELLDVGVPGLQVDRGRALAAAALVDRRDRGVQRLEEGHDAVGVPVGAADQRTARADPGVGQADAARVLGEPGHLVVAVVDRVQLVQRGVQQIARGHLRVPGAGVEEGGGAGQVVQGAHQPVERGDLVQRAGGVVLGETGRDPEHEVLRGLDDLPGDRVAQQIAAVQGAQAEVAEAVVGARVERVVHQGVEPGRVQGDEVGRAVGDQALAVADGDRGGEGHRALVGRLLGDGLGQQPGGQPGVRRVLGDQPGGGLGGQGAQLGRVGGGVAAAQRGRGDPAGVGVGEIGGEPYEVTEQFGAGAVVGVRRPGARDAEVGCGGICGGDGHGGCSPSYGGGRAGS